VTELSPAAHDGKKLETRAMADIVLFPLHRRQRLLRQLRRAQTDNEVRYTLRRTATALQRLDIAPELIDAQIRAVSLMTRREAWHYRPEGAA
jgi:hypothetical protein